MDPLSLIGGIASAGAIVSCITRTVHDLATLRVRFKEAERTLDSIISELRIVKTALNKLKTWLDQNREHNIIRTFAQDLELSLSGCGDCIKVLAEDVTEILGNSTESTPDFLVRAKAVWEDQIMKDHQMRLHHQVGALQLLLSAVHLPQPGQAAVIRQPELQKKMQQIRDDAISLSTRARLRSSQREPLETITDCSTEDSINSAPRHPELDRELVETNVYQAHGAAALATHAAFETSSVGRDVLPRTDVYPLRLNTVGLGPSMSRDEAQFTDTLPQTQQRSLSSSQPVATPTCRPVARTDTIIGGSPGPSWRANTVNLPRTRRRTAGRSNSMRDLWQGCSDRRALTKVQGQRGASPTNPLTSTGRTQRRARHRQGASQSIDLDRDPKIPGLIRVAQSGVNCDVQDLLDANNDVDIEARHQSSERTALAVAAHCGKADVCETLLSYGAKLDTIDHKHRTPLQLAVENGHLEVVQLLLEYGAIARVADTHESTPLHEAAKSGFHDIVDRLLQAGADTQVRDESSQSPIHYAALEGHIEALKALLVDKRDVDLPGKRNLTPLMLAASSGRVGIVQYLLEKKASTGSRCKDGLQAIHHAAQSGHMFSAPVIDALLASKWKAVDSRVATSRQTPLMLSAGTSFQATDLLIRRGAQLEAQDMYGMRPLHYACKFGNKKVVKSLLEAGAHLEPAESRFGARPLHFAVDVRNLHIVQLLVDKGADVEARTRHGARALSIAAASGDITVVRHLLSSASSKAVVHCQIAKGVNRYDSPLCVACKYGHGKIVAELLERGAKIRQRDEHGWHPLRYAANFGHPDVVRILLERGAELSDSGSGNRTFLDLPTFLEDEPISEKNKAGVIGLLKAARTQMQVLGDVESARGLQHGDPAALGIRTSAVTSRMRRFSFEEEEIQLDTDQPTMYQDTSSGCENNRTRRSMAQAIRLNRGSKARLEDTTVITPQSDRISIIERMAIEARRDSPTNLPNYRRRTPPLDQDTDQSIHRAPSRSRLGLSNDRESASIDSEGFPTHLRPPETNVRRSLWPFSFIGRPKERKANEKLLTAYCEAD